MMGGVVDKKKETRMGVIMTPPPKGSIALTTVGSHAEQGKMGNEQKKTEKEQKKQQKQRKQESTTSVSHPINSNHHNYRPTAPLGHTSAR